MGFRGGGYGGGGMGGGHMHDGGDRRRRVRPTRPAWPLLKRSLGLLAPHRLLVTGYLITIALVSLIGLAPPLIGGLVIGAITKSRGGDLNLLVLALVGAIAAAALLGVLQSFFKIGRAHV